MSMNLSDESYDIPNRFFLTENQQVMKFFYRATSGDYGYPLAFLHDGVLRRYNTKGEAQEGGAGCNIQSMLPPPIWSPSLDRCVLGQKLLLRDYTLASISGTRPSKHGVEYIVVHAATRGDIGKSTNVTIHSREGWESTKYQSCHDVIVAFEQKPKTSLNIAGVRSLLDRLEKSFASSDKEACKKDLERIAVGIETLLNKAAEELET